MTSDYKKRKEARDARISSTDWFGLFGKKVVVLVQFLGPKDIFIIGYNGPIHGMDEIEKELTDEDFAEMFAKGCGEYVFECCYDNGQYDEYHNCEIAPYWGIDEMAFKPYDMSDKPEAVIDSDNDSKTVVLPF